MPGFILNDGAVVPPSVYSAMNTVLNKKLGTSQVYPPRDWAAIVKDLVPLPLKSASGSIAHFEDGADTVPLKSLSYRFTPTQSGTGDPSPTNPRPITGVSSVNVMSAGKNLAKNVIFAYNPYASMTFDKAFFLPVGTYRCSISNAANMTSWRFGFRLFASDGTAIVNGITNGYVTLAPNFGWSDTYSSGTIIMESTDRTDTQVLLTIVKACYVVPCIGFGDVSASSTADYQLELGSTATTYESYQATLIPVSLGQTVYGGEGNEAGEFANKFGIALDLSALSWTYQSANNRFVSTSLASLVKAPPNNSTVVENALCEIYKVDISNNTASSAYDNIIAVSSNGNLQIRDTNLSGDLDALATRLNGIKFVYPLATPATLSVDPVAISSRLGVNNIFLDLAASEIECEYYADPTLSTL